MKPEIKERIEKIKNGEVPEGYKKTRIGVIPHDWATSKLGNLIKDMKSGLSRKLSDSDIGLPVIRSNNLINNKVDFNDLKYWYLDDPQGSSIKSYLLMDGDILINFINSTSQIGKTAIFRNEIGREVIFTTNILKMTLKEGLDSKYFIYFCETEKYFNYINSITKPAINQASFTTVEFKKMELAIPFKEEQQKIAEILSTWDKAIELKEKLIEQKKEQKRGLMKKLLTGELRLPGFDGEWKEVQLDDICKRVVRAVPKPSESYWRLGLRSHGKGTFHELVYEPDKVSMTELYVVKENDLIVNITFAWEHAIAVTDKNDEGKLVSHRFPTYVFEKDASSKFYKYYILEPKFKKLLEDISPGGAGRNRVMSQKEFPKLKVLKPPYEEQIAIGNLLECSSREINLLEKELEAIKIQKKGLMQLLLTGIVRVQS